MKLPKTIGIWMVTSGKKEVAEGGRVEKNEETEGGLSRKNWDLPPGCCHFALPHVHKNVGLGWEQTKKDHLALNRLKFGFQQEHTIINDYQYW